MFIVCRKKGSRDFVHFELRDGERTSVCGIQLIHAEGSVRIEKPILFGLHRKTSMIQPDNSLNLDGHLFFAASTEHAILRFVARQSSV